MADSWQWVLDNLVAPLIVAAILGIVAWRNWPKIIAWTRARDLVPAEGTHFTILVAALEGDGPEGRQRKHVINSLRSLFKAHVEQHAFEVRDYPKELKAGIAGNLAEIDRAAEAKGRNWLATQNADLLIWGEVAAADQVIRLRFLPRSGGSGEQQSYAFTDKLELPVDFKDDLATAVAALALAAAAPAFDQSRPLMNALKPILSPLMNLVTNGKGYFAPSVYGQLCNSAGVVHAVYATQSGDSTVLAQAIIAFRAALEVKTRRDMRADWAAVQNNMGTALATLGERSAGPAGAKHLADAVAAYTAALDIYTRRDMPAQWAMTQNNLGNVLGRLVEFSEGEVGAKHLAAQVAAYTAALEVSTRRDMPTDWAMTQNKWALRIKSWVCAARAWQGPNIWLMRFLLLGRRWRSGRARTCQPNGQ